MRSQFVIASGVSTFSRDLPPLHALYVLLSIAFFACRDELWGRFLGVPPGSGGLSIRLPPVDAPAPALENRRPRFRLCHAEHNPVSAALAKNPCDWAWSSARLAGGTPSGSACPTMGANPCQM